MIKETIQKLVNSADLTYEEATTAMKEIMSGKTTNAQIGAFLTSLRIKGETAQEITAFTSVMKEYCNKIQPTVDGKTC